MDGAHDMGGVQGFGPVMPETDDPVFHAEWEGRVFAMTLAMAKPGKSGISDMSRFAREKSERAKTISVRPIFRSGSPASNGCWRIAIWLRPGRDRHRPDQASAEKRSGAEGQRGVGGARQQGGCVRA